MNDCILLEKFLSDLAFFFFNGGKYFRIIIRNLWFLINIVNSLKFPVSKFISC